MDIRDLTSELVLEGDGIWYSKHSPVVSYPKGGNADCFSLEEGSFWFEHRNACIQAVIDAWPVPGDGAIFDIGGGNGYVSLGLVAKGHDVVLVEPGVIGARNARSRGLQNVICATMETAGFNLGAIPAVGLFDVLEHVEDANEFLTSLGGLMAPAGRLYITVPAYSFLWSLEDVVSGHYKRYTKTHLARQVEAAGFDVDFVSYFFRFLPLPVFLMRALPYRLGMASEQQVKERQVRHHNVNPGIKNSIVNALLKHEVRHIAERKVMRFGGSCLIVASKR